MLEPYDKHAKLEYKFLKFRTHNEAEQALNDMVADGWQLVSYQAAGGDTVVTHFLLIAKEAGRSESRSMGFR